MHLKRQNWIILGRAGLIRVLGLFFVIVFLSINYVYAIETIESPLDQVQSGIAPEDVTCRAGLVLIFKATDGSPACVTLFTKDRLEQRDWAENQGFGAIMPEPVPEEPIPTVETDLDEGIEGSALKLTGQGYLAEDSSSTNELTSLSMAVWVKPDYSQGSSEFTVIGKQDAFVLAINNLIPPEKKAKFSVFNGIKWSTVESETTIPEEWTHLAATFGSSSIAIYVNGKLDSTMPIEEVPSLSVSGKLTTTTVGSIKSDSEIVIGAYIAKYRNDYDIKNLFSGLIDEVKLYGSLLDESKISEIYAQNSPSIADESSSQNGIDLTVVGQTEEEGFGARLEEPTNSTETQTPTPIESWGFESEESGEFGAMLSTTSSPLQQVQNGISPEDVVCKVGLELIFKATDDSPACVTTITKDRLEQIGWAVNT